MKLLSFTTRKGQASYGLYTERGIIDLGRYLGDRYPDLKSLLAQDALSAVLPYQAVEPDYREEKVAFLPVIPNPGKIFCVGMNYADKRKEFAENSAAPTLFIRFADSQAGHCSPLLKPSCSSEFDYEGELAVIIGKAGRSIPEAQALGHVAGYSCYMDGSVRDWQYSWLMAGKNWPQTGGFGPWLVTADEVGDPHQLAIRTYLNGQKLQDDNTANMVHRIPELITYISTFSPLAAGDVIITGSPGGVGKKRTPPLFLKAGDMVEVDIEKVGRLRNQIANDGISKPA